MVSFWDTRPKQRSSYATSSASGGMSTLSFLTPLRALAPVLLASAGFFLAPVAQAQDAPRPTPRLTPRLRPRPAQPTQPRKSAQPQPSSPPQGQRPSVQKSAPSEPRSAQPEAAPPRVTPQLAQPERVEPQAPSSALVLPQMAPPMMPAYKNFPAPPGYVDRYRMNTPLLAAGGITLGITYVASFVRGAQDGFKNGMGSLAIPVVGPWLAISSRKIDCKVSVDTSQPKDLNDVDKNVNLTTKEATKCFSKEAATIAVMTGMGIGQLIGATLMAAGLLDRRHYYVRTDLTELSIEPRFDFGHYGLVLRGTL